MMTPAVATSWYSTLLLFCQIQMKGPVPCPMCLPQVPILTSLWRKTLKQSGSCMSLIQLCTGTGMCTLPWKSWVFHRKIVTTLLRIWSGCGSRGSERVLILTVLREQISGFALVWTGVGIPFSPCICLGIGTGRRFLLTVPLSRSGDFWLGLWFFLSCYGDLFPAYICCCFLGCWFLVWILLEVKYVLYILSTHWQGLILLYIPRYWNRDFKGSKIQVTLELAYKQSRPEISSLPE